MFEEKLLGSRYLLVKKLGAGSFGKTYLAQDTMLPGNPICVVKQLNPIFKENHLLDIAKRLFETEARILQKVGDRERIPQLLAYFTENQEFYLVQQYIEGLSLGQMFISGQPWSETRVITLLQNCLNILDYIHSQGIIHRDIKPANIICRQQDNKLVLVDFGAVKEVMFAQSKLLSSTVPIGTGGYMPEEQARGKPRFNSDIYALGVIAIEALTGCKRLELEEDQDKEVIWQHRAKVSADLEKIISKMIRSNFKERYESASEVAKAIERLAHNPTVIQPSHPNYYKSTKLTKDVDQAIDNKESSVISEEGPPSNPIPNPTESKSRLSSQQLEQVAPNTRKIDSVVEPELIALYQQELTNYIGPLSDFVIKDTLAKNPQIIAEQLIEKLAAEIPDSRKAEEFTRILGKSASKISNNNAVNPELIALYQQELTNYIGPLSDFVIKDTLAKNPQI
ncbi:MAG: serine/threonine-protein kinase [Xenococcaceae cyanobacterium MO_167.B52]|nr:serine/threonine-protein kinase [Xenococcaceae cyanobacterium MO_167.B52]